MLSPALKAVLLSVPAALEADSDAFVDCQITGVRVRNESGAPFIDVLGTADSDRLKEASLVLGEGQRPDKFQKALFRARNTVRDDVLGSFDARVLAGGALWTLQLDVERRGGMARSCRYELSLGG